MKFIQMHQIVAKHDAIGNDIEMINKVLCENNESYVYCELQINKNVEYIDENKMEELIADEDTVIIYHHSVYWENGYEIIKKAKCKVIFRYHNITPEKFFENYNNLLYCQCKNGREQTRKFIEERPDSHWFSDSKYNALDLAGVPADHIHICAPFNKIEEWSRTVPNEEILRELIESSTKNILFVGRVVPNKGHLMLLEIIRCYMNYYGNDIKLRVIGKFFDDIEDYTELVKNKIEEYQLKNNIEFIGEINDASLMSYYLGSDVMLVCSDHEGFCVPVVEAQFFGLPIISLNESAVPDTMGNNQLVLGRDVYKYAAAINLITNSEKYQKYLIDKGLENYNTRYSFEKIKEVFVDGLEKSGVRI